MARIAQGSVIGPALAAWLAAANLAAAQEGREWQVVARDRADARWTGRVRATPEGDGTALLLELVSPQGKTCSLRGRSPGSIRALDTNATSLTARLEQRRAEAGVVGALAAPASPLPAEPARPAGVDLELFAHRRRLRLNGALDGQEVTLQGYLLGPGEAQRQLEVARGLPAARARLNNLADRMHHEDGRDHRSQRAIDAGMAFARASAAHDDERGRLRDFLSASLGRERVRREVARVRDARPTPEARQGPLDAIEQEALFLSLAAEVARPGE